MDKVMIVFAIFLICIGTNSVHKIFPFILHHELEQNVHLFINSHSPSPTNCFHVEFYHFT